MADSFTPEQIKPAGPAVKVETKPEVLQHGVQETHEDEDLKKITDVITEVHMAGPVDHPTDDLPSEPFEAPATNSQAKFSVDDTGRYAAIHQAHIGESKGGK